MIFLGGNNLSGDIPNCIIDLPLNYLSLPSNQLTGVIPDFQQYNDLNGGMNIHLAYLSLRNNQLSGGVSESLCEINGGYQIYLNDNNLCPPYPDCLNEDIGYQDVSECCPEIQGNFNYDNNINILDVMLLINCIIYDDCNTCSDLNEDGSNDILDIIILINIILNN